MSDGASVLIP